MLRLKYLIASCALALTVGAANADTIVQFGVTGSFVSGAFSFDPGSTITIDTTIGLATNAALSLDGAAYNFTAPASERWVCLAGAGSGRLALLLN